MPKIPEAELGKIARSLDAATLEAKPIEFLSKNRPELTLDEAYRIQEITIRYRMTRGERMLGMKMGYTDQSKLKASGLAAPTYGVLMDTMQISEGMTFSLKGKIHPRIEPEIAFVLGKDLEGALSPAQALQACSGVCAAFEIVDSRYTNYEGITPIDGVADNGSASGFVLGTIMRRPDKGDVSNLGVAFEVNGKMIGFASSAASLGHPARSLSELSRVMAAKGQVLKAGSIILSGGLLPSVPLNNGDKVRALVQNLASVSISVGD